MFKYYYVLEALFVTSTDIILPTFDTGADASLVVSIGLQDEKYSLLWMLFMLLPILLNVGVTL